MHNIWYWDVYTRTNKTTTHDSKDELQYGDNPDNTSPALEHLMEVFIGDSTKTTDFSPKPIELKLKDVQLQSPDKLLTANLNNSPLSYKAVSAIAKLTWQAASEFKHKERRNLVRKIQQLINKDKRQKFQGPELAHLKYKLDNVDILTNTFIQTTSHLIPIDDKIYHPTLGITDIQQAEELLEFQLGSSTHQHICSWKRCLQGTLITSDNGEPIKCRDDIVTAVKQAKQKHKKSVKFKFGSLTGFAMSGEGIPTLQTDQMNVISHHIHSIQMKQDLWPEKDQTKWPKNIDSAESIKQQIQIAELEQQKLKL